MNTFKAKEAFGYRIEDAFIEWTKVLDRRLSDGNLGGLTRYWIILSLSSGKAISATDLADRLHIKYTTVTESIRALSDLGLVKKGASDIDHRVTSVQITQHGLAYKERCDLAILPLAKQAFERLPSEEAHRAVGLACRTCKRQSKLVYFGKMIRGDTSFAVVCQTVSMEYAEICKRHHLSSLQARILTYLAQCGPKTNMDFCRMLETDPASASRATAKLRSMGLISKQKCSSKREAPQFATQEGSYLAMQLGSEVELVLMDIFGDDYRTPLFYEAIESMIDALPKKQSRQPHARTKRAGDSPSRSESRQQAAGQEAQAGNAGCLGGR